ncbi:MAG: gliding motility protein GldN [Candidatus Delongbacteria bacterium]|jgi:gliding motility associated protien GldN|nr:gliding motility protein GldN [Candidatus Delongbacteria bacterium]
MKRQNILTLAMVLLLSGAFLPVEAQVGDVLDGAYIREHVPKREPVPLQNIREADAMYSKRILREIDMRQKINHPLYFPLQPVDYPEGKQPDRKRVNFTYLVYNIGALNPSEAKRKPMFEFDPKDFTNWYRKPIPIEDTMERKNVLTYSEEAREIDTLTGQMINVTKQRSINKRDIQSIILWEEWVFDKQRSVMDVRIIAMAPVAKYQDVSGQEYTKRLFWIYYPHYRDIFANHEVFNTYNDAERKTFDDIFLKRRFESHVLIESNVYDNRFVRDYLLGIDAMLEGKRIENELFKYEHDLWEY